MSQNLQDFLPNFLKLENSVSVFFECVGCEDGYL